MKRIIFIIIIVIGIVIIYNITKDKKIYYLSLGDELTIQDDSYPIIIKEYLLNNKKLEKIVNEYYISNMRTVDLINMINNNKEIINNNKKTTIQNSLIKADIVTISIGTNDLTLKFAMSNLYNEEEIYNYIDDYIIDLDSLLKLVRKYCKERIVFVGYYNFFNNNSLEKYYKYLISKVKKVTKKYNIYYLDIYDDLNNLNYRNNNNYPNKNGYTYIGQKIIKIIEE